MCYLGLAQALATQAGQGQPAGPGPYFGPVSGPGGAPATPGAAGAAQPSPAPSDPNSYASYAGSGSRGTNGETVYDDGTGKATKNPSGVGSLFSNSDNGQGA